MLKVISRLRSSHEPGDFPPATPRCTAPTGQGGNNVAMPCPARFEAISSDAHTLNYSKPKHTHLPVQALRQLLQRASSFGGLLHRLAILL